MIKNSTIRIFEKRGHSDHKVHLYTTTSPEGEAFLHILMQKGCEMRLPADDVILALWPCILEHIETVLQNER